MNDDESWNKVVFKSHFDEWCYKLTFDGVESEYENAETGSKGWLVVITPGDRLAAVYHDIQKQLYEVYAVIVLEDMDGNVEVKKCHSVNSARIMWQEARRDTP